MVYTFHTRVSVLNRDKHTLQYTWQTILWCCATTSNFIKYIFYSTRKWKIKDLNVIDVLLNVILCDPVKITVYILVCGLIRRHKITFTEWLKHRGRHNIATVLCVTFLNSFSCMKIVLLNSNFTAYCSHRLNETRWSHQMETFSALLALCESPNKGQWRGTLMFSLVCAWINSWVNNHVTGDLKRHRAHYDDTLMK